MVEIRNVKTKKEIKEFIEFPNQLYKDCPYYVPELVIDEKKMFKPNYMYFDQADTIMFNAYRDGIIVGRIQGIHQKVANEKWHQSNVRFTRFDSINDQEVANALFKAVEDWGKERGLKNIVGPLGFSDLDREGLLVDGFDEISTFEEQYNYSYYKDLCLNYGFTKDVGWVEYQIRKPKEPNTKMGKLSHQMLEHYHLKLKKSRSVNEFIRDYADKFFDILDKSYDKIYGTVPFTKNMVNLMKDNFKLIVNINLVAVITDEADNVVCFGISFPSLGDVLVGTGGHLGPITLIKLLHTIKHPHKMDMGLIGILPQYEGRGIASALIWENMKMLTDGGIEVAETNLNLENNMHIRNMWKNFDARQHKARWALTKEIK